MKKIKKYKRIVKKKIDALFEEIYFLIKDFKTSFLKINKSINKKIKELFKKYFPWFKKVMKFLATILGYGFLINYSLWAIWGIEFNLFTLPAYGIVFYFISEEFISLVRLTFYRR